MSRIKGRKTLTRMPLIGKIKIGIKTKNAEGVEYPTSIDYFRATGTFAQMFHKQFGQKPNKLSIIFPSDNVDDVCNQRFELRDSKGKLFAHSDSEQFHVYNKNEEDYEPVFPDNPEKYKEELRAKCNGKWNETLTLKFTIIELRGVLGVWQLTTKGKESSIPNMINIFDFVKESAGYIKGIPFDLTIHKVKSQKPDSKRNFPVLNLIPNVSPDNMQKLGEYYSHGNEMKQLCILTDEKINQLETGQQKSIPKNTTQATTKQEIDQPDKAEKSINTISEAQIKRMFACAKDSGGKNTVRAVMDAYDYEHSADILKKDYDKIISNIENFVSPEMIEK